MRGSRKFCHKGGPNLITFFFLGGGGEGGGGVVDKGIQDAYNAINGPSLACQRKHW